MDTRTPPPHWPQRAGPRPPLGLDAEEWTTIGDRPPGAVAWTYYLLRPTGEVWRREPDGTHYAPPWWELPDIVRRAVWRVMG